MEQIRSLHRQHKIIKNRGDKRGIVEKNGQIIVVVQIYWMVDGAHIKYSNSKTHFGSNVDDFNDSNVTRLNVQTKQTLLFKHGISMTRKSVNMTKKRLTYGKSAYPVQPDRSMFGATSCL